LSTPTKGAQERAELNFKKKEIQAREASKAMADYEAGMRAEREKTARLKLLREAKEAADAAAKAAGAKEAAEAKASKVAAKKALDKKAPGPVKKPAKKRVLAAARAE